MTILFMIPILCNEHAAASFLALDSFALTFLFNLCLFSQLLTHILSCQLQSFPGSESLPVDQRHCALVSGIRLQKTFLLLSYLLKSLYLSFHLLFPRKSCCNSVLRLCTLLGQLFLELSILSSKFLFMLCFLLFQFGLEKLHLCF